MTFWTDSWPVARKPHRCELCNRTIRPGEKYRRGVGMDGTVWTFKECRHCRAVMDLADPTGGDCEYFPDVLGEWEPQSVTEARWRAQWRRQWTRRDGALYPLPTRPAVSA
jgi:hypothetical protein